MNRPGEFGDWNDESNRNDGEEEDDETLRDSQWHGGRNYHTEIAERRTILGGVRDGKLIKDAQNGDKLAVSQLTWMYGPLVTACAQRYAFNRTEAELADLEQEGYRELLHCIQKFDLTRGSSFEYYARTCLRRAILDSVRNKGGIKMTPQVLSDQRKIARVRETLKQELQHEPEIKEIAERTGMSFEKVRELTDYEQRYPVNSLDQLSDDERGDLEESHSETIPIEFGIVGKYGSETVEKFRQTWSGLSRQQRFVIDAHYVLGLSFEQIGRALGGKTKQSVQQMHGRILTTFRTVLEAAQKDFDERKDKGGPSI